MEALREGRRRALARFRPVIRAQRPPGRRRDERGMNDPQIVISLEGDRHDFQPGDTLAAQYSISGLEQVEPKSLEVSVLWYTEGKGDEDLGVHYFDRVTYDDAAFARFQHPQRLTT